MTASTEETTGRSRTARAASRPAPSTGLLDEIVDAGSTVAERGVAYVRLAAQTGVTVVDRAVTSGLDVAADWARAAGPLAAFTTGPVEAVRNTWGAVNDGVRELVNAA